MRKREIERERKIPRFVSPVPERCCKKRSLLTGGLLVCVLVGASRLLVLLLASSLFFINLGNANDFSGPGPTSDGGARSIWGGRIRECESVLVFEL